MRFSALLDTPPQAPGTSGPVPDPDTCSGSAPYQLVNIGGGRPVRLDAMIDALEIALGRSAERALTPLSRATSSDYGKHGSAEGSDGLGTQNAACGRHFHLRRPVQ